MGFRREKNKGCIFFFKHIGLSPIRIGMSSQPSPEKQFKDLNREAPFGCEMIGSFATFLPRTVLAELRDSFRENRLNGDWYSVGIKDLTEAVLKLTENEDAPIIYSLNENNEVASRRGGRKRMVNVENEVMVAYAFNKKFNRGELADKLGVTRMTIHRKLKEVQKNSGTNK